MKSKCLAPVLAVFVDGHPDRKLGGLPVTDLFSKPANQSGGRGAESWRYAPGQNCFFNAVILGHIWAGCHFITVDMIVLTLFEKVD